MLSTIERILILCKTYPSPSAKHAETSCVAGIKESGELVRIYPMPFRLVNDERQFKKWQWITARIEKANGDNRPESHKIYVDTIECDESPLPSSEGGWRMRRQWLDKVVSFADFAGVEKRRIDSGNTLALLRPGRILGLDIKATDAPDWTDAEKSKLLQLQMQGSLFDQDDEGKNLKLLRKVPFDFHYRYECILDGRPTQHRHKIVDWEIGSLFWNVYKKHGQDWERVFRQKVEDDLPARDLMFLMGTIHRFPDQWLIVSLLYPPKLQPEEKNQLPLFQA